MTVAVFGPLIAPWNVEQDILGMLRVWLPDYLTEVEAQNNLPVGSVTNPPTATSYFGGLDMTSWQEDECPAVVVIALPMDTAQVFNNGYSQNYEVTVGAVVITENEDDSRRLASLYGAAIQGCVLQQRGQVASNAVMIGSPHIEFQDPDIRRLIQVSVKFEMGVDDTVDPALGPLVHGGPYAPLGSVLQVGETITAVPVTAKTFPTGAPPAVAPTVFNGGSPTNIPPILGDGGTA
jgi:hypothetical protein